MYTRSECDYLINELESLGFNREDLRESNDIYEIENLVDDIKQTYIQEYRSSYDYSPNVVERQ
jgi:hypothetical protein